jgi:hypothetical protein
LGRRNNFLCVHQAFIGGGLQALPQHGAASERIAEQLLGGSFVSGKSLLKQQLGGVVDRVGRGLVIDVGRNLRLILRKQRRDGEKTDENDTDGFHCTLCAAKTNDIW